MGAAPGASAVCSEGDKVARQQGASVQPFYRVTLQLEFHTRLNAVRTATTRKSVSP